jgi:PAS domain S-box-containing protein
MSAPLQVLLVKANQHLGEELDAIASRRGWDFSFALSGAAGIENLRQNPADIIVIDTILPDMNGFSVLASVCEHRPEAAVIMVSASETIADTLDHLDRTVTDYLIKPVTASELAAAINKTALKHNLNLQYMVETPLAATPDAKQVLEHLNAIIIGIDGSGQIADFNKCAETTSGYSREEILGQPFEKLLPPPESEKTENRDLRRLGGPRNPPEFTLPIRCADGTDISILWRPTPFLSREGNLLLQVMIGWDGRSHHSLAGEIARQSRYIADIIDNAPEAIFTTDTNDIIETWNRGAETVFGFSRAEAIGKPASILYPPSLIELGEHGFFRKKVIEEGIVKGFESSRINRQGRTILVEMTLSALKNESGEFAGILTMLRDITEKKNVENVLLRTQKLATVGQMAAHLAHEVRNPLNSVILNMDLIRDELNEYEAAGRLNVKEAVRLLDAIQREITGLTEVTNEYLQFTKTYDDRDESASINSVISEIMHFYEREISARAIKATTRLENNIPLVLCNRHRIKQALLNVIKNSIDAMARGGRLEITTHSSKDHVLVAVRDTGGGIDPKSESEICHPFFTTKPDGTGLGLAFTLQVVQHHHGKFHFDNRPGEGVTFFFEFPFTRVPLEEKK